jgi:small-conductance mechanosensitive channel
MAVMMHYVLFGNALTAWAAAAGVAVAVALLLYGFKRLLIHRLAILSRRTSTYLDDMAIKVVRATGPIFMTVMAVYAGSQFLALPAKYVNFLTHAAIGMLLLQLARWGDAGLHDWLRHYRSSRNARDVASTTSTAALGFLLRATLWLVILLMILDNFGVNITALVASLGVGGIAVALATQNILGDLFSSLSIVLDKPFVVGDFIVIGDIAGTVEYVGLKSTRVAALGGEQVVISNSDLLKSRIHNHKRMQARRIVFAIAVSYDVNEQQLLCIPRIPREVVVAQDDVNFDRAHFRGYSPSSLDSRSCISSIRPITTGTWTSSRISTWPCSSSSGRPGLRLPIRPRPCASSGWRKASGAGAARTPGKWTPSRNGIDGRMRRKRIRGGTNCSVPPLTQSAHITVRRLIFIAA